MNKTIKILLAQGHGAGKDFNRGGLYFNEGDNNFYYSLVLKEELEKYEGLQVDLLRKKITDNPTLTQRAAMGEGYDLYFAIHSNATNDPNVRGTEVWDSIERPNKTLAKSICDATVKLFNHNNRGVRYKEGQKGFNWYGELRLNKAKSAMIVENGFHTNHCDCLFFKENHKQLAEIQAKAIAGYYGLKKKGSDNMNKKEQTVSDWAKEAREWAIKNGITDGVRPKDTPTREEIWTMLYRISKLK
ncbi:N-acetylmuramoyl-L-alanine amidase family protein [Tissierella praeacuta]|uniref:N-acetylmuramoyl-L-alanine amidase family protein n=1 Tax=Tissierella praeacuta TaxID=43131 RepID=UPI003DA662C7